MTDPVQLRSLYLRDPIVWRLAWKEFRLLRSFWLGLAGLTIFLQLVVLLWPTPVGPDDRAFGVLAVDITMGALYALACGATSFATEHETGTYDFLRALPLTPGQLLTGKLIHAVLSTLAFFAAVCLMSALLTRFQIPAWEDQRNLWALWGVGALEVLVWGLFFSLLLKRPLTAAVLGVAVASVVVHFAISLMGSDFRIDSSALPYLTAMPVRLVIVAIVFTVDVWLAMRWLRERSEQPWRSRLLEGLRAAGRLKATDAAAQGYATATSRVAAIPEAPQYRLPSRYVVLGRLIWQTYRQSWRTIAGIATATFVLSAVALSYDIGNADIFSAIRGSTVITIVVTAALLGACLFLADNEKERFRFFADRGVAARRVWLSRQLFGLLAMTVIMFIGGMVVLMTFPFSGDLSNTSADETFKAIAAMFGAIVLAYAVGQWCSMFVRSGLVAGVFGLIATIGLFGWSAVMYELGIPLWWSAVPIPFVLLWATWLRAPDWLLERRTLRARIQANLSYLVPAVVLGLAVIAYRVYEIPVVDPGFSVDEFHKPRTAEARETAELYQRAWTTIEPIADPPTRGNEPSDEEPTEPRYSLAGGPLNDREVAWVTANTEPIALALEASQQPSCRFRAPRVGDHLLDSTRDAQELGRLLVTCARRLTAEGELKEALSSYLAVLRLANGLRDHGTGMDHMIADTIEQFTYDNLPYWAAAGGQTPKLIQTALVAIDQHDRRRPSFVSAIQSDYFLARAIIEGEPGVRQHILGEVLGEDSVDSWTLFDYLAPWEWRRTLRLLNLAAHHDVAVLKETESALERGDQFERPTYTWNDPEYMRVQSWVDTTAPVVGRNWSAEWYRTMMYRMATLRRAARMILALEAWRLEHGHLPESLDALVGTYLETMPLDPSTGQPFGYYPHGVPETMVFIDGSNDATNEELEANTPFVWSLAEPYKRSQSLYVHGDHHPLVVRYLKNRLEFFPYSGNWTTNADLWPIGWPFPIPAPAGETNKPAAAAVPNTILDEADK